MPFKRAVVLLFVTAGMSDRWIMFQCPLSGQLCCCSDEHGLIRLTESFNAL